MPVIKSAKKKLRKDKKRTAANDEIRAALKDILKKAKKTQKNDVIHEAFSLLDKAAKKHIIHKNKAGRLKSNLSKLIAKKPATKTPKTPAKSAKSAK